MSRKKLRKFAELETFPNVIQYPEEITPDWYFRYFGNDNPITLESACGKGEYTVGLARRFPERNFIGIDLKGARIWRGAKIALEEKLKNAMFVRADIRRLGELFTRDSISEIWITFPDPFPKKSKAPKRLTSPQFLELYHHVLGPDGVVHLKTDDDNLFGYTLDLLKSLGCTIYKVSFDLYGDSLDDEILTLKTTYERRHLEAGKTIKYLKFGFLPSSRSVSFSQIPQTGNEKIL